MAEPRTSNPTISEVLSQFIEERKGRMAARIYASQKNAIELLQHCINDYAYQLLEKDDTELFERLCGAEGTAHKEFCEIFGPEYILPSVGEFLNSFMIRKVIVGKGALRAAGMAVKHLAAWLAEKGYADAEEAAEASEQGSKGARDLPKAEDLAFSLINFVEDRPRGRLLEEVEDQFTFTRIENGKIWLEGLMDRRELGPIKVPDAISAMCQVGWRVSGIVGRVGKVWQIVESWNVYPSC